MTLSSQVFPRPSSSSSPARATPLTAGVAQRVLSAVPARHAAVAARRPRSGIGSRRARRLWRRSRRGPKRRTRGLWWAARQHSLDSRWSRGGSGTTRMPGGFRLPPALMPATRRSLRMRVTAVTAPCAPQQGWASPSETCDMGFAGSAGAYVSPLKRFAGLVVCVLIAVLIEVFGLQPGLLHVHDLPAGGERTWSTASRQEPKAR